MLAITELPAAEQELIVGCYFDDVPHAELAARVGISERAVEGRLYRRCGCCVSVCETWTAEENPTAKVVGERNTE